MATPDQPRSRPTLPDVAPEVLPSPEPPAIRQTPTEFGGGRISEVHPGMGADPQLDTPPARQPGPDPRGRA